jgi:glucose/arabinose dehydrogenase
VKKLLLSFILLFSFVTFYAQEIGIEPFATGFNLPLNIQNAGDDRLFVVEQGGLIKIVEANGSVNETPFLDLSARVSTGGERGLLGLVFHPDYTTNGLFYVNYTDVVGNTQISRFSVSDGDPNIANAASELKMLNLEQPFSNHNGGCLAFGPDGYLFIGLGDGGSAGDPGNRAQDTTVLYGSLLRLDVDSALPYSIPADNPFVGDDAQRDEIWAYGLRNPWEFSFDSANDNLWIADVGQDAFEEINKISASAAGSNYGWRCYEGNTIYNDSGNCPDPSSLTFPIATYAHENGRASITGGYVYRGERFPSLQNKYIFADFVSGELAMLDASDDTGAITYFGHFENTGFRSFGVNNDGELYVAGLASGTIYTVVDIDALSMETFNKQAVTLYPNPAKDVLHVAIGKRDAHVRISIFDILGKKILTKSLTSTESQIDISTFKKGIYLAQFESPESVSYTQKLIIH